MRFRRCIGYRDSIKGARHVNSGTWLGGNVDTNRFNTSLAAVLRVGASIESLELEGSAGRQVRAELLQERLGDINSCQMSNIRVTGRHARSSRPGWRIAR